MLRRGDRVQHPDHGPGTVRARIVLGRVVVEFDRWPRLPRTIAERDLCATRTTVTATAVQAWGTGRTPARRAGAAVATAGAPPARPLAAHEAWQTLEALRLGVVPARGVRAYTVARDAELASIDALLRTGRGCRVVWGDYGAGKTHLLEAAEQLALERGWAVARVTLDPLEHGLQHPLRLYRAIAEGVRCLDQAQPGIEHILERLVESDAHARPGGAAASRFYTPYAFVARHGEPVLTEGLRDYVRGEDVPIQLLNQCLATLGWRGERLLTLSDFRTYGRMYVHLVGTLAAWCRDAGLAGLALCFDEVERVDALDAAERRLALEVFQHYAAVLMEPGDLAFDPELLYRGGHEVHRALPLRFRPELPLVGLFALTPLSDIVERYRTVTRSGGYDLHLAPLARTDLGPLVQRVAALQALAYPEAAPSTEATLRVRALVERHVARGADSFRDAVRATVLGLDAARAGRLPELAPEGVASGRGRRR